MGRRHKGRRNAKKMRALEQISRMRKDSARALKRMRENKGRNTERTAKILGDILLKKGLIKYTAKAERWSFMDVVLKIDYIIVRLSDGMPIPIQIKSSFVSNEEKEKYSRFVEKYGCLPVFMVISPKDNNLEKLADILLRKINSWKGFFKYGEWQLKYSEFFDFDKKSGFGPLRKRIFLFFSDRKIRERKFLERQKNQEISLHEDKLEPIPS